MGNEWRESHEEHTLCITCSPGYLLFSTPDDLQGLKQQPCELSDTDGDEWSIAEEGNMTCVPGYLVNGVHVLMLTPGSRGSLQFVALLLQHVNSDQG